MQRTLTTLSSSRRFAQQSRRLEPPLAASQLCSPWYQAKKGGFKDTRPEEILSGVLRAAYTKVGLDPALIEDITVGNVLPPGGGASAARMAELHAGIPITTPISTVNRQCSSGLAATNNIAALITSGQIDIGLGAWPRQLHESFLWPPCTDSPFQLLVLSL